MDDKTKVFTVSPTSLLDCNNGRCIASETTGEGRRIHSSPQLFTVRFQTNYGPVFTQPHFNVFSLQSSVKNRLKLILKHHL
ncbi:unnamed protein product [Plutella xylostella]|uniref:(diamondback moth) hypothetical protein n=1 Tax=Plutella xylostella TaxID=51655 RepID=A0A8S4EKU6_PLUXY|nr:unnamed protein product [Plutella xylostella]